MQIRKLDRNGYLDRDEEDIPPVSYVEVKDQADEDEPLDLSGIQEAPKPAPPVKPDREEQKRSRRALPLGAAVAVLVLAGVLYNLTANRGAGNVRDDWAQLDGAAKRADFYALCNDIEGYKTAHGEYPVSLEEWSYSDHITYELLNPQIFQLGYSDGMIELRYHSGRDKDELREP